MKNAKIESIFLPNEIWQEVCSFCDRQSKCELTIVSSFFKCLLDHSCQNLHLQLTIPKGLVSVEDKLPNSVKSKKLHNTVKTSRRSKNGDENQQPNVSEEIPQIKAKVLKRILWRFSKVKNLSISIGTRSNDILSMLLAFLKIPKFLNELQDLKLHDYSALSSATSDQRHKIASQLFQQLSSRNAFKTLRIGSWVDAKFGLLPLPEIKLQKGKDVSAFNSLELTGGGQGCWGYLKGWTNLQSFSAISEMAIRNHGIPAKNIKLLFSRTQALTALIYETSRAEDDLSDTNLKWIGWACPNLKILNINCRQITSQGWASLASYKLKLDTLILNNFWPLSEKDEERGLKVLLSKSKTLKKLEINSSTITAVTCQAIATKCPNLETIAIRGANLSDISEVKILMESCKKLKQFGLQSCPQLNAGEVDKLFKCNPQIKKIAF